MTAFKAPASTQLPLAISSLKQRLSIAEHKIEQTQTAASSNTETGTSITFSPTAPTDPTPEDGDIWYDTSDGNEIYQYQASATYQYIRVNLTGAADSDWVIAVFSVYYAGEILSTSGWSATASGSPTGSPDNAINGNVLGDVFESGVDQAADQYFQVNMGSVQTFDEIDMDSGDYSDDYAQYFEVLASDDGSTWTTVVPSSTGTASPEVVTLPGTWVPYQYGQAAIASEAIGNVNLQALAVGSGNIQDSAVTNTQLATGAVATANIQSAAVTNTTIASNAVSTANIQAAAVTNTELATNAVATANIQTGAVGTTQIANGAVTPTQLNASVTSRALGGITTTIAASAPSSPITGDLWINSANGYQVNQYSGTAWVAVVFNGTDVIAANSITAAEIAAGTITASQIAAGIVLAGAVNGTTITGAQLIGQGTGNEVLAYSGTPAANNLIASISAVAGTDVPGNSVKQGIVAYGTSNSEWVALTASPGNGQGSILFNPAGTSYIDDWPQIYGESIDAGTSTEYYLLNFSSGFTTGYTAGVAGLSLISGPENASFQPAAYFNLAGHREFAIFGSGFSPGSTETIGNLPINLTNTTSYSVNGSQVGSWEQMSTAWTVPANDAAAGNVYRIITAGNGTNIATTYQLEFGLGLGLSPTFPTSVTIGSSAFTASQPFSWRTVIDITVLSVSGTTATCFASISGMIGEYGQPQSSGNANSSAFISQNSSFTFSTSSTQYFALWGNWLTGSSATTKATSYFSTYERLGP